MDNSTIIGYVKDITVAKLANDTHYASGDTGELTADFMQQIYDKLIELNEKKSK